MFSAGWLLLLAAIIGMAVVGFLLLVIRRALTELFFWRGAYAITVDRAGELFEETERVGMAAVHNGAHADEEAASPPRAEKYQGADREPTGCRPPLPRQFDETTDAVMRLARTLEIDWVSDADRDYFQANYLERSEQHAAWGILSRLMSRSQDDSTTR